VTEQEWLASDDPEPMLEHLQGRVSERKLLLFAVACCRRIWPLLRDERSRNSVTAAERWADGLCSPEEGLDARNRAIQAYDADRVAVRRAAMSIWLFGVDGAARTARAAAEGFAKAAAGPAALSTSGYATVTKARPAEEQAQCRLLRDVCGPLPFRRVGVEPAWLSWRGGLLVSAARRMYDSREFVDMPVLADALEEAGCDNPDILDHCRHGGEHVRGCWVVDALLGKQ
jgi:hypothetical protein